MHKIHPTAVVDPRAELGADVEIGPYAVVEGPARIGAGTRLLAHSMVTGFTEIGAGCVLHPCCVIGHWPQDFAFDPAGESFVRVGDGCQFREGVTVHRGTKPGSVTTVGNNVFMMANSHIAHNCTVGDNVTFANNSAIAGYVEVGARAFISGNVGVHQFVRIGALAMVGASSYLNKDVPPYCVTQGAPGGIAGMNVVGMRRSGFDQARRSHVKELFRILYRGRKAVSTALAELRTIDSEDARLFVEFITASKRGLTRYKRRAAGDDEE